MAKRCIFDFDHFPIVLIEKNIQQKQREDAVVIQNDYYLLLNEKDKNKLDETFQIANEIKNPILEYNNFKDDKNMERQRNIFHINEIYEMHEFCWHAAVIKTRVLNCVKRMKNDWKNTTTDNSKSLDLIKHQPEVTFNNYIKDKENIELKNRSDTIRDRNNDYNGPLTHNVVIVTTTSDKCEVFYDCDGNFFKFKRNIINTLNFNYINDKNQTNQTRM